MTTRQQKRRRIKQTYMHTVNFQLSEYSFLTATQHNNFTISLSVLRPFSRWTWVSRCLLKQRMTEVVVTTGAISCAKLQSNHHHQQTNIQFFTGRMPFLSPNQQCQSTKGKNITFHGLACPKLTWGLPTLSLTTNSSWLPWGMVAMPLSSAL